MSELNKPIFELGTIKIYEDGSVIGYPGIIVNRIPNTIMKVGRDSWNAAIEAAAKVAEQTSECDTSEHEIRKLKK